MGAHLAVWALLAGWIGAAPQPASSSSSTQDPTVSFASPGSKTVTLRVCNAIGECSSVTKTLTVLDPAPAITAMTVTPARIVAGRTLLLDAAATGETPQGFAWSILRNGVVVGSASGPHATWSTVGATAGAYTAELLVSSAYGAAQAAADFTVVPSSPARFYTVAPCRVLDTRTTRQALTASGAPLTISVSGVCGVPAAALAVAANVTVVAPTAQGSVSVYPADLAEGPVPSVDFQSGVTLAHGGVWPLSTDGAGRLAATASLARAGSVDLLLDVSGYFATPPGSAPLAALEMQAALCPFGFCLFAAGTEIFFSQSFSGSPSEYLYDWTGSGVFTDSSPVPIKSHVYSTAAGTVTPTVKVVSGGASAVLAQATSMYVGAEVAASLPAAPAVVSVVFVGMVSSSPIDPTLSGSHPAYLVTVANAPPNLLGYNVYASKDGAAYTLVAALQPTLPADEPLVVDNFVPPGDTLRVEISAVNFAGEGPRSAPIALTHP